ncbi:MAG TPA: hypothetical protein VIL36_10290 [Acidimicrobiales bacterium]
MTPAARLAACAVAIATGFTGGAAAGRLLGPSHHHDDPEMPAAHHHEASTTPSADAGDPHAGHHGAALQDGSGGSAAATMAASAAPTAGAGGLLVTDAGYTLAADATILTGAGGEPFTFRILGPDGRPVTAFATRHERDLHLVVVSRDLAGYHHLHPDRAGDGTWTVALPPLAPGAHHAFASFAPVGGPDLTLGTGLLVPGEAGATPLPDTGTTVALDGGYTVELDATGVTPGAASTVTVTVRRDGAPVTDLEPHLGALGHLVALRAGDLAYAHVHPVEAGGSGPSVPFVLHLDAPGDHRLFFEFAHAGTTHTAAFTLHVPTPTEAAP